MSYCYLCDGHTRRLDALRRSTLPSPITRAQLPPRHSRTCPHSSTWAHLARAAGRVQAVIEVDAGGARRGAHVIAKTLREGRGGAQKSGCVMVRESRCRRRPTRPPHVTERPTSDLAFMPSGNLTRSSTMLPDASRDLSQPAHQGRARGPNHVASQRRGVAARHTSQHGGWPPAPGRRTLVDVDPAVALCAETARHEDGRNVVHLRRRDVGCEVVVEWGMGQADAVTRRPRCGDAVSCDVSRRRHCDGSFSDAKRRHDVASTSARAGSGRGSAPRMSQQKMQPHPQTRATS